MEKKNAVPVWLTIVLAIACLAVAAYDAFLMVQLIDAISSIAIVNFCADIIVSLAAFIYCVSGYKKNTASFFKIFCIMNAVAAFMAFGMCINLAETNKMWIINAIFMLALSVLYFMFAFVKDLGRKKSYRIYLVLLGICVVYVIISSIIAPYTITLSICMMIIEFVFGVMLYGKYKDKEARGRNVD